jgi:hypothetical protein
MATRKRKMRRIVDRRKLDYNIKYLQNSRKNKDNDFLKYIKIARFYALRKYDVSLYDLEMLFFLYSEGIFTKKDFDRYQKIFPFSYRRMAKMLKAGHIIVWRKRGGKHPTIYTMSQKSKMMITRIYKYLLGDLKMSENEFNNPIFRRSERTKDNKKNKKYAKAIQHMNKENFSSDEYYEDDDE